VADFSRFAAWCRDHPIPELCEDRFALYRWLYGEEIKESVDYLEFGVWRGESILYWASEKAEEKSRFFGFDSFEGLPSDWQGVFKASVSKETFSTGGALPVTEDSRVEFIKGWFQDSLPGFLDRFERQNRLVVHLDADIYNSTLYVLTRLDPWLREGDLLLFDEFACVNHEFRALEDYLASYMRGARLIASTPRYNQVAFLWQPRSD
tara:strand:- start:453 stop:1073 length:621 start_codon:yes stop_codon:yes gene_type:complete